MFGTFFATIKKRTRKSSPLTRLFGFVVVISLFSLMAVGCGTGSNAQTPTTNPSQVTLTVTGTSGAIKQSTPVTVTIN
jgi:hypothetical protein